jgi:hypothetical protein
MSDRILYGNDEAECGNCGYICGQSYWCSQWCKDSDELNSSISACTSLITCMHVYHLMPRLWYLKMKRFYRNMFMIRR